MVVVDRSLWFGSCGAIAVIGLRVGQYGSVAVGWSFCVGRFMLVILC